MPVSSFQLPLLTVPVSMADVPPPPYPEDQVPPPEPLSVPLDDQLSLLSKVELTVIVLDALSLPPTFQVPLSEPPGRAKPKSPLPAIESFAEAVIVAVAEPLTTFQLLPEPRLYVALKVLLEVLPLPDVDVSLPVYQPKLLPLMALTRLQPRL